MKRHLGSFAAVVLFCLVQSAGEFSSVWTNDPSMVVLSTDVGYAEGRKTYLERYRILTDLNRDGTNDLILSEAREAFGNAGGNWTVYLNSNGLWRCIGNVDLYPTVVTFEPMYDGVTLWTYSHCSCSSGTFSYYRFVDGKLESGKNTSIFLEDAGDGYEDSIFVRINQAIFHHTNSHPFVVEQSETSIDGTIRWKMVKEGPRPCTQTP